MKGKERYSDLQILAICSFEKFLETKIDAPVMTEISKSIMIAIANSWREFFHKEPITKEDFDRWYCGDFDEAEDRK